MNEISGGVPDFRAAVLASVEADFAALQEDADAMRKSPTKTELQALLDSILLPAVVNVREARGFTETLRAAHAYSTMHRLFVLDKIQGEHRDQAQERWRQLAAELRAHDRVDLQVAEELRNLARELVQRLDDSTTVSKIGEFITQLSSHNENIGNIVKDLPAKDEAMSCALSDVSKKLSAIHHTLRFFTEEMIGPVARNGGSSSTTAAAGKEPGAGTETGAGTTAPATMRRETGEVTANTADAAKETAAGAMAPEAAGTRTGGAG